MKRKLLSLFFVAVLCLGFTGNVSAQLSPEQKDLYNGGILYYDRDTGTICQSGLPIAAGGVDRFLQVLSYQESGGDPKAANPKSSARGKYQYITSTWRARASIYGPAGQFSTADQAPEEIQDAVAYIEYTKAFRDLDNDLFKLAVNHFLPRANTNPAELDIIPRSNNITPRQYADKLIQNIGKGIGADIPLKYQEAPEFSTWLEQAGGAPPEVTSGTANAQTGGGCGSSVGAGGDIVEIAKREFDAGANEVNGEYLKYTGGVEADWCAYFVSWVFREAGKPFETDPMPAVASMLAYARNKGYFFDKNDASFTPQPGDVAIYKEGVGSYPSHVNIVISYDPSANTYTSIGGNESDQIKQTTISRDLSSLTGFMRVP